MPHQAFVDQLKCGAHGRQRRLKQRRGVGVDVMHLPQVDGSLAAQCGKAGANLRLDGVAGVGNRNERHHRLRAVARPSHAALGGNEHVGRGAARIRIERFDQQLQKNVKKPINGLI